MASIDLSIIVVAWNVKELLDECFTALRKSTDNYKKQILLVDNGSVDGSAQFVKEKYPEVEVIESPENLGFIRANNLAYKKALGRNILMLNSDAFVFPDTIEKTMKLLDASGNNGIVGPRLIGRDGLLQPSARYFPTPFKVFLLNMGWDGKIPFVKPLDDLAWGHDKVKECDWVVGCYLLAKKELIDKTGFFLREDFFMYNDDNDLCFRIKKLGYKILFSPVDCIHVGGANMKKMKKEGDINSKSEELRIESQFIYYRKNYGKFKVILGSFYLQFFDNIRIVKKKMKKSIPYTLEEIHNHKRIIKQVLIGTDYGNKSIH